MEVMKPCPLFIPGERHDLSVRWKENARVIECSCGMGLYGENFDGYGSEAEAIEAWNARSHPHEPSGLDGVVDGALEMFRTLENTRPSVTVHEFCITWGAALKNVCDALAALESKPSAGEAP